MNTIGKVYLQNHLSYYFIHSSTQTPYPYNFCKHLHRDYLTQASQEAGQGPLASPIRHQDQRFHREPNYLPGRNSIKTSRHRLSP